MGDGGNGPFTDPAELQRRLAGPVVDSWDLALSAGRAVKVGRAFAFVLPEALAAPSLAWVGRFLGCGRSVGPQVISLLGPGPALLPGATLPPLALPCLDLGVVTADKALYREGRDVVRLLLADPARPAAEVEVEVRLDGQELSRRPVPLDAAGLATLALPDLPAGDYEVRLAGSDGAACAFTVATYRLSPLVATLEGRRLDGGELAVTLRVEAFGTPIDGPLRVELHDRGRRVFTLAADARGGLASFRVALEGDGPHALVVQLVADPSRTASVPLTGSRSAERSLSQLCPLGIEVHASLLPSEGSVAVRGLHLTEGAVATTPFRVEGLGTGTPRLVAAVRAEAVRLVLVDPCAGGPTPRVDEREAATLQAGQEVAISLSAPLSILAIGALVNGVPWEGWVALPSPAGLLPRIVVPARSRPGDEVTVVVEADGAGDAPGSVHLVVRDARLAPGDTPESRLASQIKGCAAAAGALLHVGAPDATLADVAEALRPLPPVSAGWPEALPLDEPPPREPSAPSRFLPEEGGFEPPPLELVDELDFEEVAEDSSGSLPDAEPEKAEVALSAPVRVTSVDEPDVVFAGLVPLRGGRAEVTVRLGGAFAEYAVEAFVAAGGDWAAAGVRLRAEADTFASLELPPFVHPEDAAWGRLHAGSGSGRLRAALTRDGRPATLLLDGRPLGEGEVLPARRASLAFLAEPGGFEARVEDAATGEAEVVRGRVEAPGRFRRLVRSVRLLEEGETVSAGRDRGGTGLCLLPGVDTSLGLLLSATADYGHACCEQTAAKLLAAATMWALAGDDAGRRAAAAEVVLAGIRRAESMFLPGRGFRMYPELPPEPDRRWGPLAARHLRGLAPLASLSPGKALAEAAARGLEMAADASRAYGISWPPAVASTPEEAYAIVRHGTGGTSRRLALEAARGHVRDDGHASRQGRGAVLRRCDAAFAAAALLAGGEGPDRRPALELANAVLADLDERGRLYSTVDSVAAIALLSEVRVAGLGGDATVVLTLADGSDRTLPASEAARLPPGAVTCATALAGCACVEVTRLVEEAWGPFSSAVAASFGLFRSGQPVRRVARGDAVELRVRLLDGYRPGDLLWVCLPPALSRVVGGGQVKLFSVDFAGEDEVVVPLAATEATVDRLGGPAPQRFAACVRNMFEEERGASPGLLGVMVG